MPVIGKDTWSPTSSPSHHRFPSLTLRPSGWTSTRNIKEETVTGDESRPRVETPVTKPKSNNRVKQIFKDVLNRATKKKGSRSPEPPCRNISLPSTYIPASPSPHQLYHQQQQQLYQQHQSQDPSSPYTPKHYALTLAQRKGLITPVSRTETASNHPIDNTKNTQNGKGPRNHRESLVDPIQPQHLAFQKMELEDDLDLELAGQFPEGVLQSPFAQTSLTPPPASSVLRHSASSHHLFSHHGLGDGEPTFISPAATEPEPSPFGGGLLQKARPSSQLMPIPKELVDSGCDSMGGHEQNGSNDTMLNPSHQNLQQTLDST
ncbi:hypothetical protein BGZ65_007651, partial [Modicella reniformis]